ncbi:uncharacterized protein LOC126973797 isoform X2 [Leptidea sinapis]|uniref:uncharacterized protein LOC126973797 isoform X2 n=1 Tax=Leptidea sinapis TaxID=189913 RepID=UPI00213EB251|nr:uncharacterized protein LOC126973797 isoform X2 [Leptidea sinapis]
MTTEYDNHTCQGPPPYPGLQQSFDPAASPSTVNDPVINIISRTLAPNERIIVCGSCWQYINIRPSAKKGNNDNISQEPVSFPDPQQLSDTYQPQVEVPHGLTEIPTINIISNTLGPNSQIIVCYTCSEHKITRFERKHFTRTSYFIGSEEANEYYKYSSQHQLPPYPGLQQPSDQLNSQSQVKVQPGLTGSNVININSNTLQPNAQIIVKRKGTKNLRTSFLFGSKMETKSSATSLPQVKSLHGLTGVPVINIISNTLGPNSKITVGCLCREHISTRVESNPSVRIVSGLLGSKLSNDSYNDPYQKLTEKPIVNIHSNTMGPNSQIKVCGYNGIHIIQVDGNPSKTTYFFAIFSCLIGCWSCACYRNNSEPYCS